MTDDAVTAKLAEWETLTEAATEGPWTFEPAGESECGEPQCCYEYWDNRIWGGGAVLTESHMLSDEDAEFIAAAPTIARALLGFVREVREGHVREPYVDEPSEGFCRNCQHCGAAGTWPCPTVQAAQKWIGGEE